MALKSWVASANDPAPIFPSRTCPMVCFAMGHTVQIGVAIGDQILDLRACASEGLLKSLAQRNCRCLHGAGAQSADGARSASLVGVAARNTIAAPHRQRRRAPQKSRRVDAGAGRDAEMQLPAQIGDYTDFYASIHHATRVGKSVSPRQSAAAQLQVRAHRLSWPRFVHRASAARRFAGPMGRPSRHPPTEPTFGPARSLDYELEDGHIHRAGNALGTPIPIAEAEEHIFGLCLLNDWSARDIQVMGISTAGAVSRQELRHHYLAVDRDDGGARAISRAGRRACAGRSGAVAVSRVAIRGQRAAIDVTLRSICSPRRCGEAGTDAMSAEPRQSARSLLDARATADASRQQRLQSAHRRPAGDRHHLRTG